MIQKKLYKTKNSEFKILIITRRFHGSFLGRFQPSNLSKYKAEVLYIWSPVRYSKWDIPMQILDSIHYDINSILANREKRFNDSVLKIAQNYKPDIVYVVQGIQLNINVIETLKTNALVVCGLTDRLSLFPGIIEKLKHYETVYSYSSEDVKQLKTMNINAIFAPASTDRSIYYPIESDKIYDVSFIGVMYPDRKELLIKLVKDFPNLNIIIYGKFASRIEIFENLKWLFDKRLRATFRNKDVAPKKSNEIYNKSKICLNINRDNAGNSWAGRFACIAATESFQIMNYNALAEKYFGDSVGLYRTYDELRELISYYLEHEQEREKKGKLLSHLYFSPTFDNQIDVCKDIIDAYLNKRRIVEKRI